MEPSGRNRWRPVAHGTARKRPKQADPQSVATHGNGSGAVRVDHLLAKEEVDSLAYKEVESSGPTRRTRWDHDSLQLPRSGMNRCASPAVFPMMSLPAATAPLGSGWRQLAEAWKA